MAFLFQEVFLIAKLTDKQKKFCEEYLIDLNGTQAAIRAGYSEKTANEQSGRLLVNVSIQKYISELMKMQSQRTGITADKVLKELEKVAFTDAEITGKEKIKALEILGKHLGMFSEKVDIDADIGVQIIDDIPKAD